MRDYETECTLPEEDRTTPHPTVVKGSQIPQPSLSKGATSHPLRPRRVTPQELRGLGASTGYRATSRRSWYLPYALVERGLPWAVPNGAVSVLQREGSVQVAVSDNASCEASTPAGYAASRCPHHTFWPCTQTSDLYVIGNATSIRHLAGCRRKYSCAAHKGCRLSGAKSPVAYLGDAGERSPRSDVFVKDIHGIRRPC